MANSIRVLGLVGSYRKEGVIDTVVSGVLDSLQKSGASAEKVYLSDLDVHFCTNCRACMQEAGDVPVKCVHFDDDMRLMFEKIAQADAVVIGSPVNVGSTNALTQRFVERCAGYFHWPWGTVGGPKPRLKGTGRRAVIVSSSAAPALMNHALFGFNATVGLKFFCQAINARVVDNIRVGLITGKEFQPGKRLQKRIASAASRLV